MSEEDMKGRQFMKKSVGVVGTLLASPYSVPSSVLGANGAKAPSRGMTASLIAGSSLPFKSAGAPPAIRTHVDRGQALDDQNDKSILPRRPGRLVRRIIVASGIALILAMVCLGANSNVATQAPHHKHWVGTWAATPTALRTSFHPGDHRTLREIVHTSIGGEQVRVRLSNLFGTEPLLIRAAHVAIRDVGPSIVPESDRVLTFSRRSWVSIPPGALVLSDPANLKVPALGDLAVSIYASEIPSTPTGHGYALQTSYMVGASYFDPSKADQTGAKTLPFDTTVKSWFWLTGVDVLASENARTIVALGDSITDGSVTKPDTNHRWPNVLAERLLANHQEIAVLNEGNGGNRILHDGAGPFGPSLGPSALARFDRDVLTQPGLKYVIVLEGVNDLGQPPLSAPASEVVSADDVIAALNQLVERAHEKELLIFGATLTPFEGTTSPGYYTPEKEAKRQAINQWIRTTHAFDGVIDFDKVVRDPGDPARLLPLFDSGDHVHPNDAGCKAMGDAVDLSLFR
jgi:lysophospholipase L1-like esterase